MPEIDAKKKETKPAYTPGSIDPKLAKSLGDMSHLFEKAGVSAYGEIMGEIKKAVAEKLMGHKQQLLQAVNKEFGLRGMTHASEHTGPWMEALVADLMQSGFEPLVQALKSHPETKAEPKEEEKKEVTSTTKPKNIVARLLVLAYKAHQKGSKTIARDLFTYAMDNKDAGTVLSGLEDMNETAYQTFPTPGAGVPDHHSAEKGYLNQAQEKAEKEKVKVEHAYVLTSEQKLKAKALANKISAAGHRDLAKKVLRAIA